MVQRKYYGVADPRREFEALKPAHAALLRMMQRCRPQGPDYLILQAAKHALETAAHHFTRDPYIYFGSHKGQP